MVAILGVGESRWCYWDDPWIANRWIRVLWKNDRTGASDFSIGKLYLTFADGVKLTINDAVSRGYIAPLVPCTGYPMPGTGGDSNSISPMPNLLNGGYVKGTVWNDNGYGVGFEIMFKVLSKSCLSRVDTSCSIGDSGKCYWKIFVYGSDFELSTTPLN